MQFTYGGTNYRQEKNPKTNKPITKATAYKVLQAICPRVIDAAGIIEGMTVEEIEKKIQFLNATEAVFLNRKIRYIEEVDNLRAEAEMEKALGNNIDGEKLMQAAVAQYLKIKNDLPKPEEGDSDDDGLFFAGGDIIAE